jgi:hypothetical protein
MKILIIPGLTLPEVPEQDLARIQKAAGHNAQIIYGGAKVALGTVDLFRR